MQRVREWAHVAAVVVVGLLLSLGLDARRNIFCQHGTNQRQRREFRSCAQTRFSGGSYIDVVSSVSLGCGEKEHDCYQEGSSVQRIPTTASAYVHTVERHHM